MYRFLRKGYLFFSLVVILALIPTLVGCGEQKPTTPDKNGQQSSQSATGGNKISNLKVTLAGYSAGGASAAVGEAVGGAISRGIPGTVFNYEPGQSGANEIKVSQGETQLGLSSSLLIDAASKGVDPYKQKYQNLRAIAFLHTSDMQFIVDKRSGMTSIEDFKTKPVRIATNTKNSFMEITTREALKAYGITYEDIEKRGGKVYFTNITQALDQIRNRQLDTITMATLTPTTLFTDASSSLDLAMLPMSKEAIDKVNQAIGSRTVTIPKSTYPFLKEDQQSVGIDNILIASSEMSNDTAYAIAKALYDNLTYMYTASDTLKQMTKANMVLVGKGVQLHPGAEKFYREVGLIK